MVRARIRYLNVEAEQPILLGEPAEGIDRDEYKKRRHNATVPVQVQINNAREREAAGAKFDLDTNGWMLGSMDLSGQMSTADYYSAARVEETYFAAVTQFVKSTLPDCVHCVPFSYLTRTEDPPNLTQAYAGFAHLDYSPLFEPEWRRVLTSVFGIPAEEMRELDICCFNTWQPFDRPAHKNPLALLDYTSCEPGDALDYEGYPTISPELKLAVTNTLTPAHGLCARDAVAASRHMWYYYPDMTPNEILLFKQVETRNTDAHPARFAFHTAFHLDRPEAESSALPDRRSIEVRMLCTFRKNQKLARL